MYAKYSTIYNNGKQAIEYIMMKMASVDLGSSGYVKKAAKNDATPNADIRVPSTMLKILTLYGRNVAKHHENIINSMPGMIQPKPRGTVTVCIMKSTIRSRRYGPAK